MAYFALLWKARTIEKYRRNYESEKIKSIMLANTQIPKQSLSQRWRHYRYDTQKRISRTFRKWYPEGSSLSNLFVYLKTDQTFPNFVLKSVLGFFGGIVLTYLCFMFFVFQLSISLIHATIMSSIIGVLLTLGLAFSYRIRCLVFLLIPQFFSRVGRYTLTCYALVLILTGPATNTLKNSEVLSESLACGQEQIKTNVNQINYMMTKPLNSLKNSIKLMIDRLRGVAIQMKQLTLKINRLVLNIAQVIQSGFLWLNSLSSVCNKKLGNPYVKNIRSNKNTIILDLKTLFGANTSESNEKKISEMCSNLKPGVVCVFMEHLNGDIVPIIRKRLRNYSDRIANMFSMRVHVHHSYSFSSNDSRSASQVAAGIVTEIRKRADPLLTWLSWSSCVTSLFLLLIIFRAKYYQHMFETRSRFDNRYITKEIRNLDLNRLREGRETILPLNRRERAKYVTTTSFRLVATEKVYLNRSIVFMAITTFKLLIHMVADYSLYWVLMTIRYHGRLQSVIHPGPPTAGTHISGSGPTADLLKSLLASLGVLLEFPASTPVSCLPNPHPPDFTRYTQIGVLIFLLWFFAMFEPYGLRLRHVIMGHYQPERAKARADWLYSHILRTRGGFMKFARRKLHRSYKYRTEDNLTFRRWLNDLIPSSCLRSLLGTNPEEPHCLLCGTTYYGSTSDNELVRCRTSNCPGVYCASCFADIGELCTICLSPKDYGDFSDVSLEKGSSDESDDDEAAQGFIRKVRSSCFSVCETRKSDSSFSSKAIERFKRGTFSKMSKNVDQDSIPLLPKSNKGIENYPNDNNNMRINKKALLIRHFKQSVNNRQCNKDEREHVVYCAHCNSENCYNNLLRKSKKLKDNGKPSFKNGKTEETGNHDFITKDVKIKRTRKKYHFENTRHNIAVHGIKKRNKFQNGGYNCNNNNRRYPKNVILGNFTERALKVVSKSSIYSISLKGTNINIEKIAQATNRKSSSNIKTNRKELSADLNKKSSTRDQRKKKKTKPNKDKDVNENKETHEKITPKPTQSSCRCFRKFCNLFSGFFKNTTKISKSLDCLTKNTVRNTKPLAKYKVNHKRRKKKRPISSISEDVNIRSQEIENDDSRNYRISAYLAEQDWIKRQCKKDEDKIKIKPDISEAVAVINSTSKNKEFRETHHEEINLNIEPVVNKKLGAFQHENNIQGSQGGKNIKTEMTFSDLWKRIGFRLLSGSSSSSFMENIFKTTRDMFIKDSEKCSSSDIARRIKYYGSLGNEDFKKIENFKDDLFWGIESEQIQNSSDISVNKYPSQDPDQDHGESPCSTCTEDYRLCFEKYLVNSKNSIKIKAKKKYKKTKRLIKECLFNVYRNVSDHIRSSFESSVSYIRGLVCNSSSKEKVKKDYSKRKSIKSRKLVDKNVNTTTTHGTKKRNENEDSCDCMGPKKVSQHSSAKNPTVLLAASVNSVKGEDGKPLPETNNENGAIGKETNTETNKAPENDKEPSCPCPCPAEMRGRQTTEKGLLTAPNNTAKPCCPCSEMKGPQTAENVPNQTFINTVPILKDMKTGSNTNMNKKSINAEVQTEKKTDKETLETVPNKSVLKLTENDNWVIDDKTENKTTGKNELKAIINKSIVKMKEANKELQDVLAKSITKLTAHVTSKTEVHKTSKSDVHKTSKTDVHKSSIKIPAKEDVKSTTKSNANTQAYVDAKSGSSKILHKLGTEDVPLAANKALGTDEAKRKLSTSKGTQFFCACKSALELFDRWQNQCIQTKITKKDKKDTKNKASQSIAMKPSTKIVNDVKEPTSTETTNSSEERLITKVIMPSKRSRTSIKSQKSTSTAPIVRSSSTKSIQSKISKATVHSAKKISDSKRQAVDKVESDCPCQCVCSDTEDLEAAKETCTCATQYVYNTDDKNMQREIYEYTSSSCSDCDSLLSSSTRSDPSITDCTICSLAYVDDKPKKRKRRTRVTVVTKANQSTGTDKPNVRDVSTLTKDWWSPLVEKKEMSKEITFDTNVKEICLDKDRNFIGDQARATKSKAVKTEGKIVTFKSRAQIIPTGVQDIMSPSRYLLESQWYYNELFSSKFYAPHLFPVSLVQKPINGPKTRSPSQIHHQTRRNHKTKRLDECYSPRKQISPRRQTAGYEWIQTNENRDRHQRKKLLRTNTRPNNMKKTKHLHAKYEKMTATGRDEKFASNDDISLDVRCNSTSSL